MMIYRDIEQGTEGWHQIRLGKVTASRISDVVAKTRNGYAASRANYMAQLIAERLTEQPSDSYTSSAMQWGIDTEPKARAAYEFYRDVDVEQIAFADHPNIPMTGASPDGLILADGLLEIKCPNIATHIEYLTSQKVPKKYFYQMQWQMACLERKWCDFVSFDPRMPEHLNLWIVRIEQNDGYIEFLQKEVMKFNDELEEKIQQLNNIMEAA